MRSMGIVVSFAYNPRDAIPVPMSAINDNVDAMIIVRLLRVFLECFSMVSF